MEKRFSQTYSAHLSRKFWAFGRQRKCLFGGQRALDRRETKERTKLGVFDRTQLGLSTAIFFGNFARFFPEQNVQVLVLLDTLTPVLHTVDGVLAVLGQRHLGGRRPFALSCSPINTGSLSSQNTKTHAMQSRRNTEKRQDNAAQHTQ